MLKSILALVYIGSLDCAQQVQGLSQQSPSSPPTKSRQPIFGRKLLAEEKRSVVKYKDEKLRVLAALLRAIDMSAAFNPPDVRAASPPRKTTLQNFAMRHRLTTMSNVDEAPISTENNADAVDSSQVAAALAGVRKRVNEAASQAGRSQESLPRLVAVSKTKPVEMLRAAYNAGCRDFGENYDTEIMQKAPEMPDDVAWRFIGKLAVKKVRRLLREVPSLQCVETVASVKLADQLQAAVADLDPPRKTQLEIMLQINTSPWEGTKGGLLAEEAPDLAEHIVNSCPDLKLAGLMTIGAAGNMSCFDALVACRDSVAERIGVDSQSLELSMGMSGDFEAAIGRGSTSVRVGSSIFGAREYPPKN